MASVPADVRRIRPLETEYTPYYGRYVAQVGDGDIVAAMEDQAATLLSRWSRWTESQGAQAYAPGKWTVRQVLGHLVDTERVFVYRAMRFARADSTELSGFDENAYVDHASFDDRSLASLIREWSAVRDASVAFFDSLTEGEWARHGVANGNSVSVRALAYIAAGHTVHHDSLFKERYHL
ncbi:MAG: hypothetical protein MNPFHGCM_01695 [Gemmatimonadaceae bacterium]|nr:hypothetical protein [Gemmatimonadaceae bacterium]